VLEDDPEFNAGTGSALTRDGTVETDACVMDGATRRAGGVAAVPDLGCAIAVARAVLDDGEHVLLAGPAVWRFATERGFAPAPPGSLVTERRLAQLGDELARDRSGGTVGAVARDRHGNLAAATSTGGIVAKRSGRVGDTPIPGAGTWADSFAAVSATGDGEAILRVALARGVAAGVASGTSVDDAVVAGLRELASVTAGSAGLIAVSATGHAFAQLGESMPVAWIAGSDHGDSLGRAV
ncbi:MAG TPA: isoaspartyl peptidase/L-asparaginase, partial [Kofleriaceae bacterium]|nr:isoaspartyl peptidase/L-asparaginase [Kofleriaceae bacterium]